VIDAFATTEVIFVNADKKKLGSFKKDTNYVTGLVDSGIITNSSLSRIAVRPKCLVVEDTQIAIFKALDTVLDTKLFNFAGEFKQAKGVSKFQIIQEVYLTVQDVVGKKIALFFVQDRDGLSDRYINYIQTMYKQRHLEVYILGRHEIENYLLDGKIIRAALAAKGINLPLKDCRKLLVESADTIKAIARGDIRRKAKQVNHFCGKPENFDDKQVEVDVDQWFDTLTMNEETILRVYPGKELLKIVRSTISNKHGIDIREDDLCSALTRDRIGSDIKDILELISRQKKA
jgi:hypothetical protein